MPTPRTFPAVTRLRQHLSTPTNPPPTDAELLGRFVTSRDDDSFRELVRRHGPAVLAVCRRVTGNRDDADDAFQAAFLVLARKPDRVRAGSPLGGWLHGVAVRAARKAVARSARRRGRETLVGELPEVAERPPASDPETVRAVLEEVARLSDAYRAAVVLCELEGRTRSAAARELGIAEGTLSSRLAAARKVLARRFRDRGLVPAVLAAVAGSAACPVLAADVARLGGASASPTARVEQLSEAVMRGAILSKWKLAPVAAVLAAVGLAVSAAQPPAADNPKPSFGLITPDPEKKPAPPAEPPPLPTVSAPVAYKDLMLVLVNKDGAAAVVVTDVMKDGVGVSYKFRYESADGKTKKAGTGVVLERRLDEGGYDESLLAIKAGPIALVWSRGSTERGWIYYAPEVLQVHVANADCFADSVTVDLKGQTERKALDLKRFMRK
jgi:RNA polymerase sigma factor (sigma-70 family)